MANPSLRLRAWLPLLAAACFLTTSGQAARWKPIDPAELAMTTPLVEPGADAEALLWDVSVADIIRESGLETVYDHYLRIKLFTDRGREEQSRVDLPHGLGVRVYDVEARAVRRDGSTVELKNSDTFERDIVKAGNLKVKATSFAVPGTETGGLIEYRWRETHEDAIAHNLRLPFGRDIPVHLVQYHIQPLPTSGSQLTMRAFPFRCTPAPLVQEGPGKYLTSLSRVQAYREEPRGPSEWELKPWLLVYYDYRDTKRTPQEFWDDWRKDTAKTYRKATAPTGSVKRAAAEIVPADPSVAGTITALLDFVRTRVKRMDLDTTSESERKGFKPNKDVDDALAKGRGDAADVLLLFAALARARDLDARVVHLPSRGDVNANPAWMLPQLFTERVVAVRDGTEWRFVDPTNPYSTTGALRWTQEGQEVLVPDTEQMVLARTPLSPPESNERRRSATLTLAEDGSLEGEVTGTMTGHFGLETKYREDGLSAAEREKELTEGLSQRLPGAEISQVRVEHVTAADQPYTYRYHLRIPGYAQRAGSRLFLQPLVTQRGLPPEFGAERRTTPVWFRYSWQETDFITIVLPPGYEADTSAVPPTLQAGTVGSHAITIAASGRDLRVRRTLVFGTGGRLLFEATMYSALKRFFDDVVRRDNVSVAVRKAAAGGRS